MKKFDEWWLPDHEKHLQVWMTQKNQRVEGRLAYQYDKLSTALSFCRLHRNAIDIGAHVGLFSFHLTKQFNHTYAFEPIAEHRDCFLQNVTGDYTLLKCALGAENGYCSTKTTDGSSGDSYIVADQAGQVQMHPLDEFGLLDIDFIKIDTQGYEENILRGALKTIQRDHPIIMVEQKGDADKNFHLDKMGAVKLLESIGMKQVFPPMSGDYFMGWP